MLCCSTNIYKFSSILLHSTVYGSYEIVQKRTFLPMLILVGLFVPLLIGLLLLYPSIEGSCCGGMKSDKEKGEKDGKDVEMTPLKHSSDSE